MLFRDYVELLYQAYLQDKGYLQTLRDKIKSQEFSKDQMYDPVFENWNEIRHEDPSPTIKQGGNKIQTLLIQNRECMSLKRI